MSHVRVERSRYPSPLLSYWLSTGIPKKSLHLYLPFPFLTVEDQRLVFLFFFNGVSYHRPCDTAFYTYLVLFKEHLAIILPNY